MSELSSATAGKPSKTIPANSINCVVTSPPYFGLRDYGMDGQIGLESAPEQFVQQLVEVFREVRRVLRDDGTVWLNLGDSFAGGGCGSRDAERWPKQSRNDHMPVHVKKHTGLKAKNLLGIPWRVAFALQADGWYLRQDVVWQKPNAMPESVLDRCTRSHEFLFMLCKRDRYYYDADAIREQHVCASDKRNDGQRHTYGDDAKYNQVDKERQRARTDCVSFHPLGRNKRSVWTVPTRPFKGAHFATFPPALITPCILAGRPAG